MAVTLVEAVNRGLVSMGEGEIETFTSGNLLEIQLIDAVNESVTGVRESCYYAEWSYLHDAFASIADLTTENVGVTVDSTTVTSVTSAAAAANNFTNVAPGDWLRVTGDRTSYRIASVDVTSNPDSLVLEDAYLGTTSTAVGYRIIRDIYTLSQTDIDEVIMIAYGSAGVGYSGNRLHMVDMERLLRVSGGDLHANTSGKPLYAARIGPDSSDNKRYRLWPFPGDAMLFDVYHTTLYSILSTNSSNIFGDDAPQIALDAVVNRVRWRAAVYNNDRKQQLIWGGEDGEGGAYGVSLGKIKARESRLFRDDGGMNVQTYRGPSLSRHTGVRSESQIAFDRLGL